VTCLSCHDGVSGCHGGDSCPFANLPFINSEILRSNGGAHEERRARHALRGACGAASWVGSGQFKGARCACAGLVVGRRPRRVRARGRAGAWRAGARAARTGHSRHTSIAWFVADFFLKYLFCYCLSLTRYTPQAVVCFVVEWISAAGARPRPRPRRHILTQLAPEPSRASATIGNPMGSASDQI
jgi:hypothetical protein